MKQLCPGPYCLFSSLVLNTGLSLLCHDFISSKSLFSSAQSIPIQYLQPVSDAEYVTITLPFLTSTAGPSFTLNPCTSQSYSGVVRIIGFVARVQGFFIFAIYTSDTSAGSVFCAQSTYCSPLCINVVISSEKLSTPTSILPFSIHLPVIGFSSSHISRYGLISHTSFASPAVK